MEKEQREAIIKAVKNYKKAALKSEQALTELNEARLKLKTVSNSSVAAQDGPALLRDALAIVGDDYIANREED